MARTRKGKKAAGYDYWSRRPFSGHGFGGWVKKICNKIERAIAKRALRKELKDERE